MNIQRTTDYGKFSLHEKNRRLNYNKIEKLAEAMKKKNLLPLFPIVVNSKMEILDGQHRFEAAKRAKVTVSFVVSNQKYDIEHVADSNNFQSHWQLSDYVNYYVKENKLDYITLQKLANKYDIGVAGVANLSDKRNISADIRTGNFIFTDIAEINELLSHARAIGIEFAFPFWNSRPFLRALRHVIKVKGYNKMRMGQKIQANRKLLVKCHEADAYIRVLEEIYNSNAVEHVRFL